MRPIVHELPEPDPGTIAAFVDAMDDDLDTPGAMALVFTTVTRINSLLDADDAILALPLIAAVFSMLRAVGLELAADEEEVPDDVLALATARDHARAAKDWARADELRDELVAAGWVVEDTPDGTRVRAG